MLSNTSKYAVRAAVYLALNTDKTSKVGIKVISTDLAIPSPFLAKILQVLARQKLFSSTKGPNGGFGLLKDPFKITIYDIVTLFDGNDLFEKCMISLRSCKEDGHICPMHDTYSALREKIKSLCKEQTIGVLAGEMKFNRKIIL
jgi:Rrf2 family protein